MKTLYDYLVTVKERYNNTTSVGGKELILNTEISENDHIYVNRIGIVEAIPTEYDTPIKVGDKVLVHHNVFRRWNDQRGQEKNCRAFLFSDKYTVQQDQIWGYFRDGSFRGIPGFTFVSPIPHTERGVVKYSDQFEEGQKVGFVPGMNVPIEIEGEKYYRILNKFINVAFED